MKQSIIGICIFGFILMNVQCVQMAVTTYNTALPAVERYRNGSFKQFVWLFSSGKYSVFLMIQGK